MRTTLSLDEDLAVQLQNLQKRSGCSWKAVVNEVLRKGLAAEVAGRQHPRHLPRTEGVGLGTPRLPDISNVHEVLSLVEGEARP